MYNMILGVRSLRLFSVASSMLVVSVGVQAQINTNGCTLADFGINAGLYTNTTFTTGTVRPPAGSVDWFKASGGTGRNVISQTNASTIQTLLQGGGNPSYEARMNGSIFSQADVVSAGQYRKMIDAVWARDKLAVIPISEPTRLRRISFAVVCL